MVKKFPVQRGVECNPALDGVTHINIFSRGKTPLGKALTNMSDLGFKINKLGYFNTMEGYYWYVSTGSLYPEFMRLTAFEARRKGLKMKRVDDPAFKDKIKTAILIKLRTHQWILDDLNKTNLPLTHYYVYGKSDDDCVVRPANNSLWIVDYIESLREGQPIRGENHD